MSDHTVDLWAWPSFTLAKVGPGADSELEVKQEWETEKQREAQLQASYP